jgi:hypothetical protein
MRSRGRGLLIAMNDAPRPARSCRCERPVLDGETCMRCGRFLVFQPEPSAAPPPQVPDWTRPGVIRALRAFAFFRGRPPVDADWTGRPNDDWPRRETVVSLFGSVASAVRLARID